MQPKGGGAQVSFIFFIDIIMAISGVMLFLIILLVLDISSSAISSTSSRPSGPDKNAVITQTRELEQQITALQLKIDEFQIRSHELAVIDTSTAKALAERIKETIEKLQCDTVILDEDHQRLEHKISTAFNENQKLQNEIEVLALAKKKLETDTPKITFTLPEDDSPKHIIVIELSAERIVLQILNSEEPPHVLHERSSPGRLEYLLKTLSAYSSHKYDILVTVKPSAFEGAEELIHGICEKGFRTGYEPIEEDRSAIGW